MAAKFPVVVQNPIPGATSPRAPLLHSMEPHPLSERTRALAAKVEAIKAMKLTCCESVWNCFGCTVCCLATCGCAGFITVPASTNVAIFRCGKLDGEITTPGCHWVNPCYQRKVQQFAGTQTEKMDQLHVIDAAGNPIIVRALLEYAVHDPAALFIATNGSFTVLFNMAEQVVRQACAALPLLGEHGHDIRSQTTDLGAKMVADLQGDASVFGVTVQRLVIVEARYAPEIAAQMLMKQQAASMVSAREAIVAGALHIVRDTLREFPTMSEPCRERVVSNMLVTLTSHTAPTPTIPMA